MPDSTFFSAIKSVLIVRPNVRLGNNLLLTPLLAELEKKFPRARIDVLTSSQDAPALFSGFLTVDRVLVFPRHGASHLPAYLNVLRKLLSRHYDLVVDPSPKSRTSRLYASLVRAKLRIGFGSDQKPAAANFFTAAISQAPQHMGKYPVYLIRSVLGASGVQGQSESQAFPNLDIRLSPAEIAAARGVPPSILSSKATPRRSWSSCAMVAMHRRARRACGGAEARLPAGRSSTSGSGHACRAMGAMS
jgi:ADP-heptose:LPS heptosyltransferase